MMSFNSISGTVIIPIVIALICFLLAAAAAVCYKIFLGIWAYRDAKLRGVSLPGLTGVAVAMVPYYIGLIVYLCTRPKHPVGLTCASCNSAADADAKHCRECGQPLGEETTRPNEGKRPKPMLIGFFISLGVYVMLIVAGFVMYFAGIFGAVSSSHNYYSQNYRYEQNFEMPGEFFDDFEIFELN